MVVACRLDPASFLLHLATTTTTTTTTTLISSFFEPCIAPPSCGARTLTRGPFPSTLALLVLFWKDHHYHPPQSPGPAGPTEPIAKQHRCY